MLSEEDKKKLRRVRSAAAALLTELDGLDIDPTPEAPRKRRELKQGRVEHYANNYAMGTWRKPAELRKTKLR